MVNHGRSRACLTCKKRRVKCDTTQPSCQRCTKIGKTCPGYLDEWDLSLRDENIVVASKVNNGILSASKVPRVTTYSNLESWAIKVFYRDYVVESRGKFPGWMSFLPALYEQASDGSILRLSTCAAAFANYAQKTGEKEVEIQAIAAYNRALNMAGTVLSTCPEIPTERTMTAIFLLGLYENITSKVVDSPRQYHSVGLGTMADLRGTLLLTGNGPSLLEIVCCQMQRRNLDLELKPVAADTRLIRLLDPASPASRTIINCYDVSNFIARTNEYLKCGQISSEWYATLHFQVQELECRFQACDKEASTALVASNSRYDEVASSHRTREPVYDAYPPWLLSFGNKGKAARILMHQKILEVLDSNMNRKFSDRDAHRSLSLSIIHNLVVDILNNIPSALNYGPSLWNSSAPRSVGGYCIIWPLQVVLRCPHTNVAHRKQASKSLEKIGIECGLSYAVVYARSFEIKDEQHSHG